MHCGGTVCVCTQNGAAIAGTGRLRSNVCNKRRGIRATFLVPPMQQLIVTSLVHVRNP